MKLDNVHAHCAQSHITIFRNKKIFNSHVPRNSQKSEEKFNQYQKPYSTFENIFEFLNFFSRFCRKFIFDLLYCIYITNLVNYDEIIGEFKTVMA